MSSFFKKTNTQTKNDRRYTELSVLGARVKQQKKNTIIPVRWL